MSLLGSFVKFNRRICQAVRKAAPWLVNRSNYHKPTLARIQHDLQGLDGDILEIGGIDRPMLSKQPGRNYDGMDVDEKPSCHEIYDHFLVQSVEQAITRRYGMIISMTLLEHVPDNVASIRNIHDALHQDGVCHHYLPSANHPYSLCLRAVGPRLQKRLIHHLRTEAADTTGYPAFFHHCTVAKMRRLFARSGFQDIDIQPFYSASEYFAFFAPAWLACVLFDFVAARLRLSWLASGFIISARRGG